MKKQIQNQSLMEEEGALVTLVASCSAGEAEPFNVAHLRGAHAPHVTTK